MNILGIETSCDETAAAVVENGKTILSDVIASSQALHIETGGIVPETAARRQIESILPAINQALHKSGLTKEGIDAIAVTHGPGLIGSLLVGVETAKTLALSWKKPIVPVNHLVAHIYANFINESPQFPAIALVVSGGHTDFVLVKNHGAVEYLGGTRDDAAGEAFDKTARLVGLSYPGGPAISKAAAPAIESRSEKLSLFPRPMLDSGTLELSFSGLKTAVLNYTNENPSYDTNLIAAEVQEAIVDTLVSKSVFAVEKYKPKSFLLAGGVSANLRLRGKILQALGRETNVYVPEPKHSTDNAAMIAVASFYNYKPTPWRDIIANPSLSIED